MNATRPRLHRERERDGYLMNALPFTASMDEDEEREYWHRARLQAGTTRFSAQPYEADRRAHDPATYFRRWG